ncbi:hypothetical protein F5J12DRAFT_721843 [Pisolithus orientalis]|uniref:uncharacterized protein n=1 Tax=Pisolithus orientalis TaxID=936130 RepID=UPI00222452C1|nr:uncharacterized protein F5J12DRAFT_721843 [Pisolithus orientalis]KAI6005344.1 hypothetical protein F5J12DRAFT_721843 [Pisolithus orientalis]KAI6153565.1 hypothetical protein BKA82DRAFT_4091422 [Pisolithus tinctorius]
MPYIKAHYHPILFALITVCAMAELGLAAFLISAGNENNNWPSDRYHSVLILFEFNAVWTTLFGIAYLLWIIDGAIHFLASIASSIIWLLVTTILWGAAAGVMHGARSGGNCNWISAVSGFVEGNSPCYLPQDLSSVSRCRETLSVEAIGWIEFALCVLTLLATCMWVRTSKRSYVSEYSKLA